MPLASEGSPLAPSSTIMPCRVIPPKKTLGHHRLHRIDSIVARNLSARIKYCGAYFKYNSSTETRGTPSVCVLSAPLLNGTRRKQGFSLKATQVTECFEQVLGRFMLYLHQEAWQKNGSLSRLSTQNLKARTRHTLCSAGPQPTTAWLCDQFVGKPRRHLLSTAVRSTRVALRLTFGWKTPTRPDCGISHAGCLPSSASS